MKRFMIPLLLMLCATLFAQQPDFSYRLRHSSRDANGFIHLRFDGLEDAAQTSFETYYSLGGSWQSAEVTALGNGEMESLVPYEFGQRLRYRLRALTSYMGESMTLLHPAYQDADQFPLPISYQALIGTDPVGDSLQVYSPHLDFTDSHIACSADKLYRTIGNASGTFPTTQGIGAFNVYISTIVNPDAISDTLAFAMIYSFNIPGLLSSGLYKIGMGDGTMPSFERLGNVQNQVVDGKLQLSCNWADLSADPDFGAWPNSMNVLMIADLSMRISIDLATMTPSFAIGDNGALGLVEFSDLIYDVAQNTVPVLKIDSHNPDTGVIQLLYVDANEDIPLEATMNISDGAGGFIYLDMIPIYNPDGRISFEEITTGGNTSFSVSDNGIDFVSITPVGNEDSLQNPVPTLTCHIPSPLSGAQQMVDIRLQGLQKTPLTMKVYNLKGQKLLDLPELHPSAETAVYSWNRSQYPQLSNGIYFLRLSQPGRHNLKRFVICK